MKVPKLADEEEAIKKIFQVNYSVLKENYKILSAVGRTNNTLSIQWLTYNDYVCQKI